MGRSLIWRLEQGASFRIAEDFSLLDATDDAVELPDDAQVLLWHPVDAAAGEVEAWRTCLADYELQPLIDQLHAGAQLPEAGQWKNHALHPAGPLQIRQGALSGLLAKWNYRPGPVGTAPASTSTGWTWQARSCTSNSTTGATCRSWTWTTAWTSPMP